MTVREGVEIACRMLGFTDDEIQQAAGHADQNLPVVGDQKIPAGHEEEFIQLYVQRILEIFNMSPTTKAAFVEELKKKTDALKQNN